MNNGISKRYPTHYSLKDMPFDTVSKGNAVVIHGPAGCGKSVLRAGLATVAERDFGWTVVGIHGVPEKISTSYSDHVRQQCQQLADAIEQIEPGKALVVLDEVIFQKRDDATSQIPSIITRALKKKADILICVQMARDANILLRDKALNLELSSIRGIPLGNGYFKDDPLLTACGPKAA